MKGFLFFHSICSSLIDLQHSVHTDREKGVLTRKVDRHGQGEGGQLKTGKDVRISLMDDP